MALANGSTNNSLDPGDTITLTFNQQTNLASGTTKVCVITPGTIIVGDTAGGSSCSSGDGYNVGLITGEALGHNQVYRFSTYVTSSSAPWTMTITIVGGGSATYSGTATFTAIREHPVGGDDAPGVALYHGGFDVPAVHDDAFLTLE